MSLVDVLRNDIMATITAASPDPATPAVPAVEPAAAPDTFIDPAATTVAAPAATGEAPTADPVESYVNSLNVFEDTETPAPDQAASPEAESPTATAPKFESFRLDAALEQALATPEGRPVLAAARTLKEFSDNVMGGYVPTVEELKQYHEEAAAFSRFKADAFSGNADTLKNALKWVYEKSPDIGMVVQAIPEVLEKVNPEAYQRFSESVGNQRIQGFVDAGLRHAQQMPAGEYVISENGERQWMDNSDRVRLLDAINLVHFLATGKEHPTARGIYNGAAAPAAPQAQPDQTQQLPPEIAAQLAELETLKRAAADRARAESEQQFSVIRNEVKSSLDRQIIADATQALEPLAKLFPGSNGKHSATFEALRDQLVRATLESVRKNSSAALQNVMESASRIIKTGDRGAIPETAKQYRRTYHAHLVSCLRPMLNEHASQLMASNAIAVTRAQSLAANKQVPQGTPRPVAQPIAPVNIQQKPGEPLGDFIRREALAKAGLTVQP